MYQGEKFNSISHLVGAAFAVAATSILVTMAVMKGDAWKIIGFSVYGVMMVFLYSTSTIYHSIKQGPAKEFFKRLDHFSIYLMIAGTYTPFAIITLHGMMGWTILGVIWGLAFLGIMQELLIGKKTRILSLIIYLLMGWLIVVATKPMLENLAPEGFYWLLAGGLFYTVGVIAYVFDEKIKHGHGIWHLFVLAGSICHFACLAGYVA